VLFAILVGFAAYRASQRAALSAEETGFYVAMSPASITPVALEIAQEYAIEADLEGEQDTHAT